MSDHQAPSRERYWKELRIRNALIQSLVWVNIAIIFAAILFKPTAVENPLFLLLVLILMATTIGLSTQKQIDFDEKVLGSRDK